MAAAAAGGGASAHEPSGDNVDGGAQWFVGINDAGMPLFSWATGMPMPARVVWNIVTGLATAAGSADHRLERVCCDHCALLMDTYSHGEDSVVTAALHSTRPTNLTSPAHAGALRPPDVRALYEVVQMLVGSRALNSSNADKLKLIVRVCTGAWLPSTTPHPKLVPRDAQVAARPVLYAISQLRRAQANLFVPSVQLLPHAEAPHKLCGTLSAKLGTPWVALVSGGVLYAASKEW